MSYSRRSREAVDIVIPTRRGKDLQSEERSIDGHIRIETYDAVGTRLFLDLFTSNVRLEEGAHTNSLDFPYSEVGADEATKLLQKLGFRVAVVIK